MNELSHRFDPIAPHFTSLGTGVVDFGRIVATLARTGYDSWLVVEQDASPDPYATSRASRQHMRLEMSRLTS
ncbi:MAG: sugar phosphate isomerase/epimerase [Lentisphaerae bacterium]|jgi:sugar phosphate isomerase/epimerase|nr:sugar phosphate isomerase/epimerase [Lentisphaerota bacterium]MBT4819567.1 sugar phosphate isomerase/epimerase [Lentisphaerota bacterium]MBT5607100.1 sugar phosphate isomerase/epimerase [Lentisphaerota bacterium]MBT7059227.1 sugar phosphate isomerase/epimerase [Lentisphaerota bacterium]MBT7846576.1 sugar phosphate isomerase/epimerase [Lentisphaerota bacterium]